MFALANYAYSACLTLLTGRLVAGLITDFLQVFNLDFTLAVFQPEISTVRQCHVIRNTVIYAVRFEVVIQKFMHMCYDIFFD